MMGKTYTILLSSDILIDVTDEGRRSYPQNLKGLFHIEYLVSGISHGP